MTNWNDRHLQYGEQKTVIKTFFISFNKQIYIAKKVKKSKLQQKKHPGPGWARWKAETTFYQDCAFNTTSMRTVPLVKQKGKENQNHREFIYYILQDPPESINGAKILTNYSYIPLLSFSLAEVTNLQAEWKSFFCYS